MSKHIQTPKDRARRLSVLTALFAALLLLAACNDPQRALAPPDADVTGIQTVIVFPFTNLTNERDLEGAVAIGLADRLGAVGWYNVLGPDRLAAHMAEQRIDAQNTDYASAEWNEIARDIAIELNADGFILGAVAEYGDSLTIAAAYTNPHSEDMQWLADQSTNVTVTVRGRLVNVHTGATVYERTVTGVGRIVEARQLNWVIPASPPDTLIPAPHRRDIDAARDAAIADALDRFSSDILPQPATNAEVQQNSENEQRREAEQGRDE